LTIPQGADVSDNKIRLYAFKGLTINEDQVFFGYPNRGDDK
jgi:hypothetical protein